MEDGSEIYLEYIPKDLHEKKFTLQQFLQVVKLKVVSASSQILQYQIQVGNNLLSLGQLDMKNHRLSFNYPYDQFFNDTDKQFLLYHSYSNKFLKVVSPRQPKVNKIKQESGVDAQIHGSLFEEHCSLMLNENNNFRNEAVLKILKDLNLDPKENQVSFIHQGDEHVANLDGNKILPKADILVHIKNIKQQKDYVRGISVKKTNLSTQIHICSVEGFKKVLQQNYQVTMPLHVESGLKKFVGADGFSPRETLSPLQVKKLGQGERNRFLLQELNEEEQSAMLEWFNLNLASILKLILGEGSVEDSKYHAHYLICNKTSYTQAQDWSPVFMSIEEIISKVSEEKVTFSQSGGAIKFGDKITLQMKGSGGPKQRTSLQFKKSL